jgi:hypothetical protein
MRKNRDWNWNGAGGGEHAVFRADGGDGIIKPAIRIWDAKVKPISGLERRAASQ